VVYEANPLMTFLISAMVSSYSWFEIGLRQKYNTQFPKPIRILGLIMLWFYLTLIILMNVVYCVNHDYAMFKKLTAIVLVAIYIVMHGILMASNAFLMIVLVEKMNIFLGTIIVCLLARIVGAIVYLVINHSDLTDVTSFEITLILGINELFPVIAILYSFTKFSWSHNSNMMAGESNIQSSRESFSQSLLFGKDESIINIEKSYVNQE
jgi:hypothetical protein